jgi:GNAT superfamily N-acetyltransferase
VIGYYCLAAGALGHEDAPKALRRNIPDPIPVMVLGRLAIDRHYQNIGLGKALLLDATRRTLQVSRISRVKALLVHTISEPARRFYLGRGFIPSPVKPMMLMLVLTSVEKVITSE